MSDHAPPLMTQDFPPAFQYVAWAFQALARALHALVASR